ncbi:MAG: hypothetical protein AB1540_01450 [Bdellovibrionota bacterium]
MIRALALGLVVLVFSACSTVYPLKSMAKRTSDPRVFRSDIRVDTASRDVGKLQKIAWAAYSVNFDCANECGYAEEEQKALAKEIAETSFAALDREIRKALLSHDPAVSRSVLDTASTVRLAAFAQEIKTDSYRSTVNRWLAKLGLNKSSEIKATAQNLKYLDPSEIGWSGEESLAKLGQSLGVDGVLVGHIRVSVDSPKESGAEKRSALKIQGPKVWIFSATSAKAIAMAELRPNWQLDRQSSDGQSLDWTGLDDVASGFSSRVAQALKE